MYLSDPKRFPNTTLLLTLWELHDAMVAHCQKAQSNVEEMKAYFCNPGFTREAGRSWGFFASANLVLDQIEKLERRL